MTAGTITLSGKMCSTMLFFNAEDHWGSDWNHTMGPSWSTQYNNDHCPFDDPGCGGSLGPNANVPDQEYCTGVAVGFGAALDLNSGTPGAGESFMPVFVR